MSFDTNEYWLKVGPNFKHRVDEKFLEQEHELVDILRILHDRYKFKTVLDVGANFGRITRLIKENFWNVKVECVDLLKYDVLEAEAYYVGDISDFCLKKKYDLIIAVEVLMHLDEDKYLKAINNMLKMTRKALVTVDYAKEGKFAPHCFYHNYHGIRRELSTGQAIFVQVCDYWSG